jgi:hypothetical protein
MLERSCWFASSRQEPTPPPPIIVAIPANHCYTGLLLRLYCPRHPWSNISNTCSGIARVSEQAFPGVLSDLDALGTDSAEVYETSQKRPRCPAWIDATTNTKEGPRFGTNAGQYASSHTVRPITRRHKDYLRDKRVSGLERLGAAKRRNRSAEPSRLLAF